MTLYRISALTRYVGYRPGPTHKHTSTFIISDIGYLATHLAMILYNPFPVSESNTKSMITPGDSFMTKGKLYAAQLCYIGSAAELGTAAQVRRQFFLFLQLFIIYIFQVCFVAFVRARQEPGAVCHHCGHPGHEDLRFRAEAREQGVRDALLAGSVDFLVLIYSNCSVCSLTSTFTV